ncbi:hypothetical protein ACW2Q0_09990 [Nocardia sp. R16R-3T]
MNARVPAHDASASGVEHSYRRVRGFDSGVDPGREFANGCHALGVPCDVTGALEDLTGTQRAGRRVVGLAMIGSAAGVLALRSRIRVSREIDVMSRRGGSEIA